MRTRAEKIEEFLKTVKVENLCVLDYIDIEEVNSYDDIYEAIDENGGFNVEIIYYSRAIEYLSENDPSLSESLELAEDMGFRVSNLSSEILASLLASQYARDEFVHYENEIQNFFNELEDSNDDDKY